MSFKGHEFGGDWTREKLELLNSYMNFFTIALKKIGFTLHYIDGFAGTGEQTITLHAAPLLGQESKKVSLDGSVKLALDLSRPFDRYHFIELNDIHFEQLEKLRKEYPEHNINLYKGDANQEVVKLCNTINWKSSRAILFLDPYGMEVDWDTLQVISSTEAIDLWFLFPLSGLFRQAANKKSKVDKGKEAALDRMLGTEEWRTAFYSKPPQFEMMDLFDEPIKQDEERCLNVPELESWVTNRLKETFPFVLEPITLKRNGIPIFSLFFAVSNPSPRALNLAKKVVKDITKRWQ